MRYALEYRPASIGAVPRGYSAIEQSDIPEARHGVIVYDSPLTDEEMLGYELRPILNDVEVAALAEAVANKFDRYRDKMVRLYDEKEINMVRQMIASRFEHMYPTRPIVGDFDEFVRQVLESVRGLP